MNYYTTDTNTYIREVHTLITSGTLLDLCVTTNKILDQGKEPEL